MKVHFDNEWQDWPLQIEDNYYRQHQVVLEPGEMFFYEGPGSNMDALRP